MKRIEAKKRSNLRDVAKAAGVSVATVSRVLNSPDSVNEQTRKKVQQKIDELKFVPSAAARAINSGRSRFVGALVPTLDNAIFARFLNSLEQGLGTHRLSLIVATTDSDPEKESQKARELLDIGAEGLVVSGVTHDPDFHALLRQRRTPTIATSFYDPNHYLPTVGYDNASAAQIAINHLRDLGHTHIAIIYASPKNNDRTIARLNGIKAIEEGLELSYFETEMSQSGGASAALEICKNPRLPSAVFCLSDVLATGALFGLQSQHLKVPDDISLMGLDDLPGSAVIFPSLSTVHLPVSRMGSITANALADWVERGKIPSSTLLSARLVKRGSTKRA